MRRGTVYRIAIFLGLLLLAGCDEGGTSLPYFIDWSRPFTQVTIGCIDGITAWNGPTTGWVVRTQNEYDSLIDAVYQQPLDRERAAWYPVFYAEVRRDYPHLSAEESARIAEQRLDQFALFLWTKECTNPPIDFSSLTLLGFGIYSTGCDRPDYLIDVGTDRLAGEVSLHVNVTGDNACEMLHYKIIWVLVPKIPAEYSVRFTSERSIVEN